MSAMTKEQRRVRDMMRMRNEPKSYKLWLAMRTRCNNPNFWAYKYYGGRGIRVCARWDSYANFVFDMGEPPSGLTLDRVDGNQDYSPDNCRWATRQEQSRNRRGSWLTPHIAQWIQYLRNDLGWKLNEIAAFFDRPRSTICNALYVKSWRAAA